MHGPHPRLVINSSVISVFITQTEIDFQGSDSSGFLLRKKVPFFKHLETWKISVALFDCFIVLFMKAGSALQYPDTRLSFQPLSVHGLFLKMHNEIVMTFLQPCSYEAVIVKYCNDIGQASLLGTIVCKRFVDDLCFTAHFWWASKGGGKKTIDLQKTCMTRIWNV